MMVGLITRDANNNITTSMTKRLSQGAGSVVTNRSNGQAGISLPPGRRYFYIVVALEASGRTGGSKPGINIFNQNTISWNYSLPNPGSWAMNCEIFYGYY